LIPDIPPFAVDRNAPVYCNVQFSNQFTLRGALLTPKNKGLLMELFWQSLAEQPLKYVVFVHLIDQSGKILGQVDYNQYNQAPAVERYLAWRKPARLGVMSSNCPAIN
jgi:hypothetical protein